MSQDFDPLFQNDIPKSILTKEIEMFKAEPYRNCFE